MKKPSTTRAIEALAALLLPPLLVWRWDHEMVRLYDCPPVPAWVGWSVGVVLAALILRWPFGAKGVRP